MSQHEAELKRRLARGADHLPATGRWFMRVVADDRLEWRDLSLLETKFFKRVGQAYFRWKGKQK